MDSLLNVINVIISFSMVMLLLSIVTSSLAQAWLALFKTKARALGTGLSGVLMDFGLAKDAAKSNINALLDRGDSIFGEKIGGLISNISSFLLASSPKEISREEFLLLLLKKAKNDDALAKVLGFKNKADADAKLIEVEKEILNQEKSNPQFPSQVWRASAMQEKVPELAAKLFSRFDDAIDRINDGLNQWAKLLGIIITLPLIVLYWPVDSIELFNRLNNDAAVSKQIADVAEAQAKNIGVAQENLSNCLKQAEAARTARNNPGDGKAVSSDDTEPCKTQNEALSEIANKLLNSQNEIQGLIPKLLDMDKAIIKDSKECEGKLKSKEEKIKIEDPCLSRARISPGILITWILVSLGSAFWLGVVNKMLGIRSEFSNKLNQQREFRASSQQ